MVTGQIPQAIGIVGENRHTVWPLHRGQGGDDLAPDPQQRSTPEMPFMAGRQTSQNSRFAARPHTGIRLGPLGFGNLLDNGRTAHDQVMQRCVDLVDFPAKIIQIWFGLFHALASLCPVGYPKDSFISSLPMRCQHLPTDHLNRRND